jgi:hypothetical protein
MDTNPDPDRHAWMPISIRHIDADPTGSGFGSGSTTLTGTVLINGTRFYFCYILSPSPLWRLFLAHLCQDEVDMVAYLNQALPRVGHLETFRLLYSSLAKLNRR